MILEWTLDPKVPELRTVTYKHKVLTISEVGPGDFFGTVDDLDHKFVGESPEEVEGKLIAFVG